MINENLVTDHKASKLNSDFLQGKVSKTNVRLITEVILDSQVVNTPQPLFLLIIRAIFKQKPV